MWGGPGGKDAGGDSNVGVIARDYKSETGGACRRYGKIEGSASGFNAERKAGIECHREIRGSCENGRVRSIFQFERQALPFLAGVENGHAGCQWNFGRPLMKDFSLKLHRPLNPFVAHAELQAPTLHVLRKRRPV